MKGEKLLYFWTISFPINTTDDTAYILLNKWLTRIKNGLYVKRLLMDSRETAKWYYTLSYGH